ncbi:MAG: hydantoinase/oxoprolinase family protein [Ardenticatenaceae bacterium]|nr:hydantoinase/oxoprolinase family protein [Ardenticatenaceae bacterium]
MTLLSIGVDVGGTFTDFVLIRDGQIAVHKRLTTPDDQSQAILDGLEALGVSPAAPAEIVHGTTIVTNALLERRGARTVLVTTRGFADVLVLGRQNRPHLYRLSQQRPVPLVPDELRFEAEERLDAEGHVLMPLDEAALDAVAEALLAAGVESVAVVLLFSFLNPDHEQRAADRLRAHLGPGIPLSLSCEILPEYREYERTATVVINAYVQPLVRRYLARLQEGLAGRGVRDRGPGPTDRAGLRLMQSSGGAISAAQATAQAARLALSGPAGGVVGAFDLARRALDDPAPAIITFDMGGTSTDVALCPGDVPRTTEGSVAELPLRLPMIDIHTVGAGGGSLARVDPGGALRVGPESAGALPGPVAYGRGGTRPTITDANVVLGRLPAAHFLGGQMALDVTAAGTALATLGEPLVLTPEAAALGMIRVANATMERALRRVSVERGYDPRHFTLVAFGGAGPLHACELAAALGITRILLPPHPGVLSALGLLVADVVRDYVRTLLRPLAALTPDDFTQAFDPLAERAQADLRAEGITTPRLEPALGLRYLGQSYELTVPVTSWRPADIAAAFHQAHAQRYGASDETAPVECVALRLRAAGERARPPLAPAPLGPADASLARIDSALVWFDRRGPMETALFARDELRPGMVVAGPTIVVQLDATTLVPPGWQAVVDGWSNVMITK